MDTYCTYKDEQYKVIDFGELSDKYMRKHLCLNKIYVNTTDRFGRYTRIDLVECSNFTQAT